MQALEDRLQKLERTNRRWRWAALGLGTALVAMSAMAAHRADDVADLVQARRFEMVNDKGLPLVAIEQVGGAPLISLRSQEGDPAVTILATDEGGHLTIANEKLQQVVALGTTVKGAGTVTTFDGRGNELVEIGATVDGVGTLTSFKGKGEPLVEIGPTEGGMGSVTTLNGQGGVLVRLAAFDGGNGAISTYNGKGQELVRLISTSTGGGIGVLNNSGKQVATIHVDRANCGLITVHDFDGNTQQVMAGLPR